jgi:hypothetical protein
LQRSARSSSVSARSTSSCCSSSSGGAGDVSGTAAAAASSPRTDASVRAAAATSAAAWYGCTAIAAMYCASAATDVPEASWMRPLCSGTRAQRRNARNGDGSTVTTVRADGCSTYRDEHFCAKPRVNAADNFRGDVHKIIGATQRSRRGVHLATRAREPNDIAGDLHRHFHSKGCDDWHSAICTAPQSIPTSKGRQEAHARHDDTGESVHVSPGGGLRT